MVQEGERDSKELQRLAIGEFLLQKSLFRFLGADCSGVSIKRQNVLFVLRIGGRMRQGKGRN